MALRAARAAHVNGAATDLSGEELLEDPVDLARVALRPAARVHPTCQTVLAISAGLDRHAAKPRVVRLEQLVVLPPEDASAVAYPGDDCATEPSQHSC